MAFTILLFPSLGHSAIVCAACHPKETAFYFKSPMANSLGPPARVPAARILHPRSESAIRVETGAEMIHRLSQRGLTAEYAIDYQIGAGIHGPSEDHVRHECLSTDCGGDPGDLPGWRQPGSTPKMSPTEAWWCTSPAEA
jgi:hypothetical protein